jgi:hypothetical protein
MTCCPVRDSCSQINRSGSRTVAAPVLCACTYVRERRPPPDTVVVPPAPQPAPVVVVPPRAVPVAPSY